MTARLKNAIKHIHVSSNIKTHEICSFNNIENTITPGSELALLKLIIGIREKDGRRFAVTITRNWNNLMELWVKKKDIKHTGVVVSHLPSWSYKLHGDKVLTTLTAEDQK